MDSEVVFFESVRPRNYIVFTLLVVTGLSVGPLLIWLARESGAVESLSVGQLVGAAIMAVFFGLCGWIESAPAKVMILESGVIDRGIFKDWSKFCRVEALELNVFGHSRYGICMRRRYFSFVRTRLLLPKDFSREDCIALLKDLRVGVVKVQPHLRIIADE